MLVFVRALTYAILFISLFLIYVPTHILSRFGYVRPAAFEIQQIIAVIVGITGAAIAVWCILTFATIGKGTPAPFDPPQKLVIEGPYRFVRNPMYVGASLALTGAAIFYQSWFLFSYAAFFFLVSHLFVVFYEEPVLRRTFGDDYEVYCNKVKRWWPGLHCNSS
jgi:protein-S-isoprenylcysteine O-methyltransferase Ste14